MKTIKLLSTIGILTLISIVIVTFLNICYHEYFALGLLFIVIAAILIGIIINNTTAFFEELKDID
jgi:hypothetical protein